MPGKKENRVKLAVVEEGDELLSEEQVKSSETENPALECHETELTSELKEEKLEKGNSPAEAIEEELHKEEKEQNLSENEKEKKIQTNQSQYVESPPKENIPFWVLFMAFLIGLSLGAGLIGGIFYYKSKVESVETEKTPAPEATIQPSETITQSPTPSPEAKEKADLSKLSVQILNGSGIAGEAGKVEKLLKDAGFTKTVSGNAKSYNYNETEISFKENVDPEATDKLKEALKSYKLKEMDNLPDTAKNDIEIIVGKSKS